MNYKIKIKPQQKNSLKLKRIYKLLRVVNKFVFQLVLSLRSNEEKNY